MPGGVCDDGRQLGVSPGDIALHQRRVLRTPARERLDDVADSVRKLSQDLVRFVSCHRLVYVRLPAGVDVRGINDHRLVSLTTLSCS